MTDRSGWQIACLDCNKTVHHPHVVEEGLRSSLPKGWRWDYEMSSSSLGRWICGECYADKYCPACRRTKGQTPVRIGPMELYADPDVPRDYLVPLFHSPDCARASLRDEGGASE